MPEQTPNYQRPFLKWAGGKYKLLDAILEKLPSGKRLVEPFAGSGVVFLNSDYPNYLVADSNKDLIELFKVLKKEGKQFIIDCHRMFTATNNTSEQFYRLREQFNEERSDYRRRALLFVYFNKHCFNGLCRYNKSGGFNVPFGRYKKPAFPDEAMKAFHRKAQQADFRSQDFEKTFADCQPGDVVYCDPPYAPLMHQNHTFSTYSTNGVEFSHEQHIRLAQLAKETAKRGIPVLLSNHNTPFTQQIYKDAEISTLEVRRTISRDGGNRGMAKELLALFHAV